jgi:hypothetical protein
MGERVARVGRACSRCNLRHPTQSPWPFALPSLIVDVVADGGVSPNLEAACLTSDGGDGAYVALALPQT